MRNSISMRRGLWAVLYASGHGVEWFRLYGAGTLTILKNRPGPIPVSVFTMNVSVA